ncbi:MAG: sugar transporter [Mucilaginibacter polytrichastri]|nr:sugar transporter [Mucilaginibacter polytrichastri]
MKKIFLFIFFAAASFAAKAQILNPVKWSYAAKKTGANEAVVFFKATIDKGWHIYSQHVKDGGPVATAFTFSPSKEFTKTGETSEPKPLSKYESVFKMQVSYFENAVIFQQKVKLTGAQATVKGKLEYMVCNDRQCLPPEEKEFSIAVK